MPLGTLDRRTRIRATRRQEVLDAAWEVARERGIAGLTLREVAARVGMRAPSLYEYFDSKESIYDAMFAAGYEAFLEILPGENDPTDAQARASLWLRRFFAFCRADVARYQLLFQPAVPGFHPSDESMQLAGRALAALDLEMAAIGIRRSAAKDLWTALVTGMVNQQIANGPAGDRWERLTDEAVAMFIDFMERREELG